MSNQALNIGPVVDGEGDGSRIVRCSVPACDVLLVVGLEDSKVRWQSFRKGGIEELGRRVGREKA